MDVNMEKRKRIAQRAGRSLVCPKCKELLLVGYDHDVEVDYCEKCLGLWIDICEERQLLDIKPEVFSVDELKRLRKLYQPMEHIDPHGYIPCPVCHQMMNRKNWGGYSGVIVDRCEQHGTWYDKGEMDKIREYIALGGIEYEKLQITERGISELDNKIMVKTYQLEKDIQDYYTRGRFYNMIGFW